MNRFRFRFQRILDLSEREEEQRKNELAAAMGKVYAEEQKSAHLHRTRDFSENEVLALSERGQLNLTELTLFWSYLQRLEREMGDQRTRIRAAEQDAEKKRQILLEATMDKKKLENLKERRYAEYLKEVNREERATLDEVGSRTVALKKRISE